MAINRTGNLTHDMKAVQAHQETDDTRDSSLETRMDQVEVSGGGVDWEPRITSLEARVTELEAGSSQPLMTFFVASAKADDDTDISIDDLQAVGNLHAAPFLVTADDSSTPTGAEGEWDTEVNWQTSDLDPLTYGTVTLRAYAKDTAGNVSAPISLNISIVDTTNPNAPTISGVTAVNTTTLRIASTGSTDVDGQAGDGGSGVVSYNIYVDSEGTASITGVSGFPYDVSGFTENTAHTFEIQAVDAQTNVSTKSASDGATTTAAAAATDRLMIGIDLTAAPSDAYLRIAVVNAPTTPVVKIDGVACTLLGVWSDTSGHDWTRLKPYGLVREGLLSAVSEIPVAPDIVEVQLPSGLSNGTQTITIDTVTGSAPILIDGSMRLLFVDNSYVGTNSGTEAQPWVDLLTWQSGTRQTGDIVYVVGTETIYTDSSNSGSSTYNAVLCFYRTNCPGGTEASPSAITAYPLNGSTRSPTRARPLVNETGANQAILTCDTTACTICWFDIDGEQATRVGQGTSDWVRLFGVMFKNGGGQSSAIQSHGVQKFAALFCTTADTGDVANNQSQTMYDGGQNGPTPSLAAECRLNWNNIRNWAGGSGIQFYGHSDDEFRARIEANYNVIDTADPASNRGNAINFGGSDASPTGTGDTATQNWRDYQEMIGNTVRGATEEIWIRGAPHTLDTSDIPTICNHNVCFGGVTSGYSSDIKVDSVGPGSTFTNNLLSIGIDFDNPSTSGNYTESGTTISNDPESVLP